MNFEHEDYFELDKNFEFNTGINQILDNEVEKRVLAKIQDYNHVMERSKESEKKIGELRNQYRKLETELKDAEKTYFKQGEDKALREMLGGFKLGDEVWFVKKKYLSVTCTTCSGDRKVSATFDNKILKVDCPKCKGHGSTGKYEYNAETGKIKEITIHTWAEGRQKEVTIYIKPVIGDPVETREFPFATKEECEEKITELKEANK